ncbi:MAG: LUD domain-containing protein [Thermoleophilia bacterium]
MARVGTRDIGGEIRRALADPGLQRALGNAMATLYGRRDAALAGIDFEDLRTRARALKEEALARNEELLAQVVDRVTALGGTVVLAADAAEARDYVGRLARERGVQRVVKGKSMVSEEVHLNQALEALGVEVIETDLGERIIQLAGERPSHLIVPAIHKTKDDVIALFARTMGIAHPPSEAEDLTRLVRDDLREKFLTADMGITGANFVVAETGTLVLVENEGNIRLSSQLPPIHVALTGREKIVEKLADVAVFLELLPRSGTGQLLTSYVSLITGPPSTDLLDFGRATGGTVHGREFHLVIVDNGRSTAARDPELREALYCIRCGACLNACAPYTRVGGHVYGADPYPGGIGCAWTYITRGHAAAKEINGLCTTCSRCTEVCPIKIDIPWLNTVIKERNNREFGPGLRERLFARADLLADAGSALAPLANAVIGSRAARSPLAWVGVDPERRMPRYERGTLETWFRGRGHVRIPQARAKAALFVDCFVNHNLPGVGRAAVEVLERAGVEVVLAHNACCGRPALSQGLLDKPRAWAAANLAELGGLVEQGYDIVCIEPSCLSTLREDYRRLLETTPLAADGRLGLLEAHVFDITEYLVRLAQDGGLGLELRPLEESFAVHGHCHQKSLGLGSCPAEAVRLVPGVTVREVEALCCGMVGSFGYKAEYSPLSQAIGARLFEKLAEAGGSVVACGISCRSQIEMGTGRRVEHPVEVILRALV